MPDPIRKRFGYGQLWPMRPACSQNRPGPYMPDPTFRIRFSSVFPKKAWIILCETDLGGLVRVWPNTSGLEANRCAGIIAPCFWQDANGPLPVSHRQARLCSSTDVPGNIVPGLGRTDPVRKQADVQESSGPLLANASQPIRIGCESDPACLLGLCC